MHISFCRSSLWIKTVVMMNIIIKPWVTAWGVQQLEEWRLHVWKCYRWQKRSRTFQQTCPFAPSSSQCHLGETTEILKRFLCAAEEGMRQWGKRRAMLQTPADIPTAGGGWVRTQTASQTDRTTNCENSPHRRPLFLSVQHPLLFHMTATNNLPLVQNWQ